MNYPDSNDLYQGKFTDGDPLTGLPASQDSAEQMNAVYDELINLIREGDVVENVGALSQLALSVKNQIRGTSVMTTRGNANDIQLTSPAGKQTVQALKDYDKIYFRVNASNSQSNVTLTIDGLAPIALSNVVGANQLLQGALVTVTYLEGHFWLTEQINPKTGNDVNDIGKLIVDTTNHTAPGEIVLDGSTLSRTEHPIYWAKVQTISNLIDQAQKDAGPQTYAGYYGTGDGSTTFTLPIVGGEFIRMFDGGRGVDAGRVFGSYQEDGYGEHTHSVSAFYVTNPSGAFVVNDGNSDALAGTDFANANYGYRDTTSWNIQKSGGDETRPRNIAYYGKTRL
ncbi:hypothetical protein MSP8887_02657 [Marinomonas spartinae]|uniref:hypothetical protein n=1 Tax=Marinomonas spartinae TaxID=1792290 RepID=UPI000808E4ED|nr:hypothetical protein [Marinomonas spartinae]SBS36627.1 hypothetical protein MSP8887_02657 [Marinomonas spartinae]